MPGIRQFLVARDVKATPLTGESLLTAPQRVWTNLQTQTKSRTHESGGNGLDGGYANSHKSGTRWSCNVEGPKQVAHMRNLFVPWNILFLLKCKGSPQLLKQKLDLQLRMPRSVYRRLKTGLDATNFILCAPAWCYWYDRVVYGQEYFCWSDDVD